MDGKRKLISGFAAYMNLNRMVRFSDQPVIFPFYHSVSDQPLAHIRHLYPVRTGREFEQDMDEILKGFEPVSLGDYLEGKKLLKGKHYMVLTFDDGLRECHQLIAPMLKKKGVPAAFFLNNQFIDNRVLFYRYKASLLIDRIKSEPGIGKKVSEYFGVPEQRVADTILMIGEDQVPLLEDLLKETGIDIDGYLKEIPVYLNSNQVADLVEWGFEIGGHSTDHANFSRMEPGEIMIQVQSSIKDLQLRFKISTRYFSFPFTSAGIPEKVIDKLLEENVADVLMGTAGLKKTGKTGFVQRIPMEEFDSPAGKALKTEYLYYLLKGIIGRNSIRY